MSDRLTAPETSLVQSEVVEKPKHTASVDLPPVEVGLHQEVIKAVIHTDMLIALVYHLQELKDRQPEYFHRLKIEGRDLTETQLRKLRHHPLHRFFSESRYQRSDPSLQDSALELLFPASLSLTLDQQAKWPYLTYTPHTLSEQLGFKTKYYPASAILKMYEERGFINELLPILEGVNHFEIGSNNLSENILKRIAQGINQNFFDYEEDALRLKTDPAATEKLIQAGILKRHTVGARHS